MQRKQQASRGSSGHSSLQRVFLETRYIVHLSTPRHFLFLEQYGTPADMHRHHILRGFLPLAASFVSCHLPWLYLPHLSSPSITHCLEIFGGYGMRKVVFHEVDLSSPPVRLGRRSSSGRVAWRAYLMAATPGCLARQRHGLRVCCCYAPPLLLVLAGHNICWPSVSRLYTTPLEFYPHIRLPHQSDEHENPGIGHLALRWADRKSSPFIHAGTPEHTASHTLADSHSDMILCLLNGWGTIRVGCQPAGILLTTCVPHSELIHGW